MARKAKIRRSNGPPGPKEVNAADARLTVGTYKDVADDEDQYFLDQDAIAFDEHKTKRQRRQEAEDEFLALSDGEDYGAYSDDDEEKMARKAAKAAEKAARKKIKSSGSEEKKDGDKDEEEQEDDELWWGSDKREYYDGDQIETEEAAKEEEEAARALQKQQLGRMQASDFFDDWAEEDEENDEEDKDKETPVTALTKTADEIDAMSPEDQYRELQMLYPEIDHMCDAFLALEPLLPAYQKRAQGKPADSLEVVAFRVLGCYLAALAMYFALLMAPSRDDPQGDRILMDPAELHSHEVMEKLVDCKATWERVQRQEKKANERSERKRREESEEKKKSERSEDEDEEDLPEDMLAEIPESFKSKKAKDGKKTTAKKTKRAVPLEVLENDGLDALNVLLRPKKRKLEEEEEEEEDDDEEEEDDDDDNDLGEQETLDARTADAKEKRKKSLAFYTSQIMQKANQRTVLSGDADIPYRERLRDRQARLNAAAEKRGRAVDEAEDDDDEEDEQVATRKNEDLEYYQSIVQKHGQKVAAKADRKAAIEAGRLDRFEPELWQDEAGRRKLTREIQKNKGLQHRRLKERKNNPRVKKRLRFEKKQKQNASMRQVGRVGVDAHKYSGEKTGIHTGLIRSIKLG